MVGPGLGGVDIIGHPTAPGPPTRHPSTAKTAAAQASPALPGSSRLSPTSSAARDKMRAQGEAKARTRAETVSHPSIEAPRASSAQAASPRQVEEEFTPFVSGEPAPSGGTPSSSSGPPSGGSGAGGSPPPASGRQVEEEFGL